MAEYNGWTNYETWNVALWIDNDQGTYRMVQDWAETAVARIRLGYINASAYLTSDEQATRIVAEQIKELVEEENPLGNDASMYSDMLSAAISEVDWSEIAKSRIEEGDKEEVEK